MVQASAEKLEHTGPAQKESGLSAITREVGKYARAAFAKRKRNRAVCPKHQIVRRERVKVSDSPTLRKKEDQSGSMERKGWTLQRRKADSKEVRDGKQGEPP